MACREAKRKRGPERPKEEQTWATAMTDGPHSNEPTTDADAGATASPAAGIIAADGTSAQPAGDERSAKAPRVIWLLAALIVIGLPTAVGLAMLIRPPSLVVSAGESASLGELSSSAPLRARGGEDVTRPGWVRSDWADAVPGMTAFELTSDSDVSLGNGRLRPSLGISCADGRTDVHMTTGGTAPIDPETAGHSVTLTFDQSRPQSQQWVAAHDQRALFAQDGLAVAGQISTARELRFGFTHYMSGPVVVDFDLRGADEVMVAMVEPCGWDD